MIGQRLRPRPRSRPAVQLRQRFAHRGQCRARQRQMRVHLQRQQEPLCRQLVRGLPDRRSFHRRLRAQRDHRQRLRQQPHAGDVCRHAPAGLVGARARQLLQRQSGVRPQGRRHRRHRLPSERPHGSGDLAGARRQAAAEQPGRAGGALGAGAISGDPSGRRDRHRAADDGRRIRRRWRGWRHDATTPSSCAASRAAMASRSRSATSI